MDCLICGASARKLGTNFHGDIYDCVACGSFVVSADVLKENLSEELCQLRKPACG